MSSVDEETLRADVRLLSSILGDTIREHDGPGMLELVDGLRQAAIALRQGRLPGGRDELSRRVAQLGLEALEQVARAFTQFFHLANAAEEQQRIRVLRQRDGRPGATSVLEGAIDGSIAEAGAQLLRAGVHPDEVQALLGRLFVMPVLTAHPTEARRRTLLDHLRELARTLDRLDDPRPGATERARITEALRETVTLLYVTEEARNARPSPFDEVRAGLHVFEHTLLDVTPAIYRALEDTLAAAWPGEHFALGPVLRWGTWIGGDRDGNPHVTAEVTRFAFERQRALALGRYLADVNQLGHALSVSARRVPAEGLAELRASLELERERLPEVAARARRQAGLEPWREKLLFVRARLEATGVRGDAAYADARGYLDDLRLLERSLEACGLSRVARGRLRDARRRAEVFGFHLATLDLRQHSAVHEVAVGELLARGGAGGAGGYAAMPERERVALLAGLLERADVGAPRDRDGLSPATAELLASLDVVGRARRELGPEACERYVISFTSAPSDVLEVLFLARAAHLAPDELRPVPLLEQLDDLTGAGPLVSRLLDLRPVRAALRGELEVMLGYSDSSKQAGYVASNVALYRAQETLAALAAERGFTLTIFHGRGGAIGRGGGPANRAIRAQPPAALAGRLRVTEQGETITARYGRHEIARRDLEQMMSAVIVGSACAPCNDDASPDEVRAREATARRAAEAALAAYRELLADPDRLVAYAAAATPLFEIADLPLASRPASRRHSAALVFDELRAIPWVFSWNQSRHGLPGWYGLGAALDEIERAEGGERGRQLYQRWPFFRALIDNAELALVRSDIEVAEQYARLAGDEGRSIFDHIRAEYYRTVRAVLAVTRHDELLAGYPALLHTVRRRNPYIDVLSHTQIELLARLRAARDAGERERIREILFITINGIAAGLQTAG